MILCQMKPVDQTKFGSEEGNCLAASLASIFGCSIEECPEFKERTWWNQVIEWCRSRNTQALFATVDDLNGRVPSGYVIAGGPAARGLEHACVALNGVIVHDPHPSRAGLIKIQDYIIFVPLVPEIVRTA